MKKHFEDSEDEENKDNWLAVRDCLSQIIEKAKDWTDADCLSDLNDMAQHFTRAYPDVHCTVQDLRMALHDLNINQERNEHNNKYYYLAKWK
jgi:hypothetical protein